MKKTFITTFMFLCS